MRGRRTGGKGTRASSCGDGGQRVAARRMRGVSSLSNETLLHAMARAKIRKEMVKGKEGADRQRGQRRRGRRNMRLGGRGRNARARSLEHVLRSTLGFATHILIINIYFSRTTKHIAFLASKCAYLCLQLFQKHLSERLCRGRILTCDQIASDDHLVLHADNRDDEIRSVHLGDS